MARRIKGILFDLGDTLLDFGEVNVTRLFEAGGHLAYRYLRNLRQPLPSFGRYLRSQLWSIRWHYMISRITKREFNSLHLIARHGAKMGQDLTREHTLELAWLWYQPLSEAATVEEGLADILRGLRDCGLVLGLVSNTFIPAAVLDRHLAREGLLDLLPLRLYSSEVGVRKPSRRIFRIALERAGLEPGETLFVGDSPRADIRGANRSGLISVLKDPDGRYPNSRVRSRHRIRRIAEVPDIVEQYNSPEAGGQAPRAEGELA